MYIKPLSAIIDSHSIIDHSFADDLQSLMSAPPDRISELLHSMQSSMSDVKACAIAIMLKLNDNKTKFMFVTSNRSRHLHNLPYINNHRKYSISLQAVFEKLGSYIRLSSYHECTCHQNCSDMLF